MTPDVRMRRESRADLRLYGWLTWRNAIRLSLPVVGAVALGLPQSGDLSFTLVSLLVSVGVGFAWIKLRWEGHHPEYHLYHLVRWFLAGRRS